MNTDQLRDEYESTMTSEQIWLLGYWAEVGTELGKLIDRVLASWRESSK